MYFRSTSIDTRYIFLVWDTSTVEYQYNAINGVQEMGPHYKWYRLILAYLYRKYYTFGVHDPIVLYWFSHYIGTRYTGISL